MRARVVSHPRNRGNGAAVKTGARHASRALVIFMDADGQHKPEDIPRIVEPLAATPPYDMAVGARTKDSDSAWYRDLANAIYNRFSSYLASYKIEDLTSGFRAIPRHLLLQFVPLLPNSFSYPTTITLAMLRSGLSVAYVPIVAKKRVGKSKIKLFRDGFRFLMIITKVATLFSPMRVFLPISLVLFFGGLAYYAATYILLNRFTNGGQMLLLTGVMIFMMGLVAEQIADLRQSRLTLHVRDAKDSSQMP